MKRRIMVMALLAVFMWLMAGGAAQAGEKHVVTTIFPLAEWTRAVIGEENLEVDTLLTGTTDMHSHQASAADIMLLSQCDVLVYIGGESDAWIEDVLSQQGGGGPRSVRLLDALGDRARAEALLEGMQAGDEEEEGAADEHIWLSIKNARVCVAAISEALCEIDPSRADTYRQNAQAYDDQLAVLDQAYADTISGAQRKTLLFGDRFPFRYLAEDYGLECYAAFPGCSAETEASFSTVVFLAGKVDEARLPCVMTIEGSDQALARTIIDNTQSKGQKIITLNSMQSVIPQGATYLSIMEDNLTLLKEALN